MRKPTALMVSSYLLLKSCEIAAIAADRRQNRPTIDPRGFPDRQVRVARNRGASVAKREYRYQGHHR